MPRTACRVADLDLFWGGDLQEVGLFLFIWLDVVVHLLDTSFRIGMVEHPQAAPASSLPNSERSSAG